MKCGMHPKYNGEVQPPRVPCFDCWHIYLSKNPQVLQTVVEVVEQLW